MFNPFLFGDTPLEIANHFDSDDYVYDIELNPIKGIFKPELTQTHYDLLLVLPSEYYHSITASYSLQKHHHFFDGYQFYISYINSICLLTIPTISRTHTNLIVEKLYELFSFTKIITIEWNESINCIQYIKSSYVKEDEKYEKLQLPNALSTLNATFFTFAEFHQLHCVSLQCPSFRTLVQEIIEYLKKVTELENIELPSTSFSISNLYA